MNLGLGEYGPLFQLVPLPSTTCSVFTGASPTPHDVDADGDTDWILIFGVAATCTQPHGFVYLNDGTGTLTALAGAMPQLPPGTLSATGADFDGDGDLDLVVRGEGPQGPRTTPDLYLENDGTGHFTLRTGRIPAFLDSITLRLVAADLDGDGDLDLVRSTVFGAPTVRILLNTGSGHFQHTQDLASSCGMPSIEADDVDGDGCADLVITDHYSARPVELWMSSRSGYMTNQSSLLPVAPGTRHGLAALRDFDGDGDPDIVVPERFTRRGPYRVVRFLRNDGTGRFHDASDDLMPVIGDELPPASWANFYDVFYASPADQDGDGDLDLLVTPGLGPATPGPGGYTLWNLTRHLSTTGDPAIGQTDYEVTMFADPGHVVVPFVSSGRTIVDLPGLGTLQIDSRSIVAGPPLQTDSSRTATLAMAIPNDPGLIGVSLYWQGVDIDTATGQPHLTNAVVDTIR